MAGEFMSSLTTKKAISYALKDLLKTNPFSKITINDIAASCNINKQTFYYHFLDKEDLVEWICKEEMVVSLIIKIPLSLGKKSFYLSLL